MPSIQVELGDNSYSIVVNQGILGETGELLRSRTNSKKVIVIADAFVSTRYGHEVMEGLSNAGFDSHITEVPSGEEHKSLEWFGRLHDQLVSHRMDRTSTLIALGGGVIGDLAGFVAATYMRGISYVQIPTTLQAQVDASVGGKTGINHPKGKNLIGAFYQPELVLIDVATLKTLPSRDVRAGFIEVIKHGVIMDVPLFNQIEENLDAILNLDAEILINVIAKSCADKAEVVANDEKENRLRMTLNYGHTFGHALEVVTDYNVFRHGEAVAIGMNCAAQLSCNIDMLPLADMKRQKKLIKRAGLPTKLPPEVRPDMLLDAMYLDKKAKGGKLHLVLPTRIGEVEIRDDIDDSDVLYAISQCIGDA
ncbi:MAG: 3-dehydroquinate synthase [Candidatus Poribacteria bacterium]|nr:3-dehydroquinate synthase [Candidatus Poribacteria bacterium]MDE0502907.1 3-dehydroquinate synthase [Candidatus Poribacteria bacterium]